MSTEMIPSVIDYLLQLPEAMHFAKVHELCSDGISSYRMLSDYGSGTFQLIEFENNLLLILIGDYKPKDTFEKITEISEDYMEISQFETDSSSFKIGGRKRNQVDKGIYCYLNTQKKTYTYCEGGKAVRFTKVILPLNTSRLISSCTMKIMPDFSVLQGIIFSKILTSRNSISYFSRYGTARQRELL